METINEYRLTIYRDGEVEMKDYKHQVIKENDKNIVIESELGNFEVLSKKGHLFYGMRTSLDKALVSEGRYYNDSFEQKQGVISYLYSRSQKLEAIKTMKDAIIEKYAWINSDSIDSAINKII